MGNGKSMSALSSFCALIAEDARITPTHISLYVALLNAWERAGCTNPLLISRDVVMLAAKISARQTYNRAMNELNNYGYIIYVPSKDPRSRCKVWMNEPKDKTKPVPQQGLYIDKKRRDGNSDERRPRTFQDPIIGRHQAFDHARQLNNTQKMAQT